MARIMHFLNTGNNRGTVPRLHERVYCTMDTPSTHQRVLQTITAEPKFPDLMDQSSQVVWEFTAIRVNV
jgi:hypothetical protein